MLKKLLMVVLALGFGLPMAAAQDEAPACDIAALTSGYTESLAAAQTVEDLQALHDQLASDIAVCQGLAFTGSGNQTVGPLELEEGLYIVEYGYTEGAKIFLATVTAIGSDEVLAPIFAASAGQSNSGTLEFKGGKYLFSLQAQGEWHFNLTQVE